MAESNTLMTPKLLDALYTESMVLADEARSYFESGRFNDECHDEAALSVAFSCESLKVTTRLMHCIAWLLNQKSLHGDELTDGEAWNHDRELGYAAASDGPVVDLFPFEAQQIINASEELFQRLQRLSVRMEYQEAPEPPVHNLFRRLESSF
jgi:regulator of CtrA degradation